MKHLVVTLLTIQITSVFYTNGTQQVNFCVSGMKTNQIYFLEGTQDYPYHTNFGTLKAWFAPSSTTNVSVNSLSDKAFFRVRTIE